MLLMQLRFYQISMQTKKSGSEQTASKPRPKATAGGTPGLLPPPPGGLKIAGPPRAGRSSPSEQSVVPLPTAPADNLLQTSTTKNSSNDFDFLLDIGASTGSSQPSTQQPQQSFQQLSTQPAQSVDPWGDFTG